MKLNSKFLVPLCAVAISAAAVITATVLRAEDKTAATNAPAKAGGSTSKIEDLFPDPVIARGTGIEIKRSALDEAVSSIRASATAHGQQIPPDLMPRIEKESFDHLLQVKLLKDKATDADKAAGKIEGDKRMEGIRKRAPSEDILVRQLKALNLTVDELHSRLTEEATAEEVLRDKVTVTDADVKKFYEDNPSKFEEPEKVKVSHILVATGDPRSPMSDDAKKAKLKVAEGLLKRAKANEDFGKLVKEYSEDPGSKDKGGEYTFGHGEMIKEFEAAAFSLQTNQISDIVTTAYGYHIIKLLEKIPAKKLAFADTKPDIKNYLERMQMEKILPDYYVTLKKEAKVQILDDQLKALEDAPMDLPKGGIAPSATVAPK
ncbi:MAG TPA: peptidylprolyl isomerase [Verrucomicrobiae bacterium]|nr:peptidylprolyl isomerase [Verrucomicrobiae bacterium]